ncbi:MAG: hypothetical protein GKR93_11950 [Gammaproteobacteria bacterium]|nr:hypothetical protein [Gammaproteobacteria bacterium]
MIRNAPAKHPGSAKWYYVKWSAKELQCADITTATWTVPAGITKDDESVSGLVTGIKVSGGTEGEKYEPEVEIVTSMPETLHEQIRIYISSDGGH